MRRLAPLLLIALLGTAALPGCRGERTAVAPAVEPPAPAAPRPTFRDHNLVFVSFDALQASHVGCLGYRRDVTPTIDAIAKQGYLFSDAISVASWTVPASMTWFTGVYPSEHRMVNKFSVFQPPVRKMAKLRELAPDLVTLADILKRRGYVTGGFTGNAGVSGGFGYDQGFDTYFFEWGKFGSMDQSIPVALEWLRANKDNKFFCFLHGYDIHGQNTPATGFDYRFVDPNYNKRYTGSEQEQELLREEGLEKGKLTMRDEDVRFWRDVYDEKIQRTDAKFRRFLDEFDKLGVTGRTLFVLTSDHGTEFYEHRRFDHGFTLYQEQIHVPLIIRLPGQTEDQRVAERVSSIDVMPTILDLLDVPLSDRERGQLRGMSLTGVMNGGRAPRDIFSETDYRHYTYKRSIIAPDGWKLIYTLEDKTRELFDLKADPTEANDLAPQQPRLADALQRRLFAHFKSIGHDLEARRWERGMNPVYPSQDKADPMK